MWMEERGVQPRLIIRDRDTKFGELFDGVFTMRGVHP
jgi:hypothetical protein